MNNQQTETVWYQWSKLGETALSRFARYGTLNRLELEEDQVGDMALDALAKVAWNTALAESLTPVLQAVEIGLRNWLDKAIAQYLVHSHPNPTRWLRDPPNWTHVNELDVMQKAKDKLTDQAKNGTAKAFGHNDVLATASFSLWSNMIRNNEVWVALTRYKQGTLTRDVKRKELHKVFDAFETSAIAHIISNPSSAKKISSRSTRMLSNS